MSVETPWLVGRRAIGDYAGGYGPWYVTAMIKAGLRCHGGKVKGSEPRAKREWVDQFFEENPNFVASRHHARVRVL